MNLGRLPKAAEQRDPAVVLQVSWANGLDIIRDFTAQGVPALALDANARALGLHSRLAAGMVCPDPKQNEEAFVSFLGELGRRLPRRAVPHPRRVHLADLAPRRSPGDRLHHPLLALGDDATPARQAATD